MWAQEPPNTVNQVTVAFQQNVPPNVQTIPNATPNGAKTAKRPVKRTAIVVPATRVITESVTALAPAIVAPAVQAFTP